MTHGGHLVIIVLPIKSKMATAKKPCVFCCFVCFCFVFVYVFVFVFAFLLLFLLFLF